jgi:hypothetical protein
MTGAEIAHHIETDTVPDDWPWESALDSAMGNNEHRDAADAARFLDTLYPGRAWTAAEYHGLMYHHFTGRWASAATIGYIRADEKHDDMVLVAEGSATALERADRLHTQRTASDEAAEQYIRGIVGTYLFDCPDGSVLTFDGIFNGQINEEEPV